MTGPLGYRGRYATEMIANGFVGGNVLLRD
jgi:hypothetical protein